MDVDHRDVCLSNLKFIHECTQSAAASGINRLAGAGQREPRRTVRRGGLVLDRGRLAGLGWVAGSVVCVGG